MLLAGGACLAMLSAPAATREFRGKTIEVIVPSGAGGGLTRNARGSQRIFLRYSRNPNVIVKNIVGGGGRGYQLRL